jgi:environmental stress-induced protein Ves
MFTRLIDQAKIVVGAPPAALATTAGDGDFVSLKGYDRLTIILSVLNGTTVTGGAITLLQATDVSGTGAKALAFDKVYANVDTAAGEALTEQHVHHRYHQLQVAAVRHGNQVLGLGRGGRLRLRARR